MEQFPEGGDVMEQSWMLSSSLLDEQPPEDDDGTKQIVIQMPKFEFNRLLVEHQMKFNAEKRKNRDSAEELESLKKQFMSVSEEKNAKIAKLKHRVQELEEALRAERDRKPPEVDHEENSRLSAALAEAQRTRQEVMERMNNLENIINELQNNTPKKKRRNAWKRFLQRLQETWRKGCSF